MTISPQKKKRIAVAKAYLTRKDNEAQRKFERELARRRAAYFKYVNSFRTAAKAVALVAFVFAASPADAHPDHAPHCHCNHR